MRRWDSGATWLWGSCRQVGLALWPQKALSCSPSAQPGLGSPLASLRGPPGGPPLPPSLGPCRCSVRRGLVLSWRLVSSRGTPRPEGRASPKVTRHPDAEPWARLGGTCPSEEACSGGFEKSRGCESQGRSRNLPHPPPFTAMLAPRQPFSLNLPPPARRQMEKN